MDTCGRSSETKHQDQLMQSGERFLHESKLPAWWTACNFPRLDITQQPYMCLYQTCLSVLDAYLQTLGGAEKKIWASVEDKVRNMESDASLLHVWIWEKCENMQFSWGWYQTFHLCVNTVHVHEKLLIFKWLSTKSASEARTQTSWNIFS